MPTTPEQDLRRSRDKPWRALYNTKRWKQLRLGQLSRHPLCLRCQRMGRVVPARVAHHVVPHKGDPKLFFDASNLSSSCFDCHDVDEQRIEKGGRARTSVGADGWPIDSLDDNE